MKLMKYTAILAITLGIHGVACAASLTDDFETDTSANYTGGNSFNSGGSFSVSAGNLNVTAGSNNTYSVVHTTSSLAVGESYSIDMLDPYTGSGVTTGEDGQFLMLTTSTGQPNGTASFGFRLRIDRSTTIRLNTYTNGGSTLFDTGVSTGVAPTTFWVDRVSATEFEFYYGAAGSRTFIATGTLTASEAANPIHVGVQAYNTSGGTELYHFDNLKVASIPSAAAPVSLTITPSVGSPGSYDFSWNSQTGKVYDLVSSTDLATAPGTWAVWSGNSGIAATPPLNTLTAINGGGDPRRFFVVIEKDAP